MPPIVLFSTAVHDKSSHSCDERPFLRISKGASLPHARFSQRRLHSSKLAILNFVTLKLVTLKPVILTFVIPSDAKNLCPRWQNRRGQRGLAPEFLLPGCFTCKYLRLNMLAGCYRVRASQLSRMNILEIGKESERRLAGRSSQIEISGCGEQWSRR